MLYTTPPDAWHCTWLCEAHIQLLSHGNPFHEALPSFCADINASGSLELFSYGISVGALRTMCFSI